MNIKKELILAIVVLLLVLQIACFFIIKSVPFLTGSATSNTQGDVEFCLDAPPVITSIGAQSATAGTAFALQVTATDTGDDDSLSFSDNTSLFAISSGGSISFTPTASDVGAQDILITSEDNAGCKGYNTTNAFTLTISASASGEGGGTGSGGGGGGGGGGGSGAAIANTVDFEVSLNSEKSQEARMSEGDSTVFNFGGKH